MAKKRVAKYQIQNLSTDGYGRLVQVVGGTLYDGFGNEVQISPDSTTDIPSLDELNAAIAQLESLVANAADKNFEHIQNVPSARWEITHNLDKRVSVVIIDSAGTYVQGEVTYDSIDPKNKIIIEFNSGFSGKAIIN